MKKTDCIVQKIIASSEFKRLKRVRQLGPLPLHLPEPYVHNRFDHSTAVERLATVVFDTVVRNCAAAAASTSPGDRLCVRLAALLHDVGHCFDSHFFDSHLLPLTKTPSAKHEIRSCIIARHLLRGALPSPAIDRVCAIIVGDRSLFSSERAWMVDIVNAETLESLDVDRLCYLRDDFRLLASWHVLGFDVDRVARNARVRNGRLVFNRYFVARAHELRTILHDRFFRDAKTLSAERDQIAVCKKDWGRALSRADMTCIATILRFSIAPPSLFI